MAKKNVAIVGATGIAGQQIIVALENHPWYEISVLAASERSAGKKYADAITDPSGAKKWFCKEQPSERTLNLMVQDASKLDPKAAGIDLVFTAVESDVAKIIEPQYARDVPVISTASAFRYEKDVPILVPGVNTEQAKLIEVQKKNRGWNGFIAPVPNCTTTGLVMTLKPIADAFGIESLIVTTMQGISGAGRSPGVIALDIVDNIIPFISKEEEKVQIETKKIFGSFNGDSITDAPFPVSATCTRACVLEGHTESAFVSCGRPVEAEDVKKAMRDYAPTDILALPSAPKCLITVHDDPYRPQPRLDRDADGGMTTSVGRIRKDNVLKNGVKYLLVSHNTMMGAGKGAVFVAEALQKLYGYI